MKVAGQFPANAAKIPASSADAILCYSVFHYVFGFMDVYGFIDEALQLLKPGGEFLLGDIPNISKRNRFLQTPTGEAFHKNLLNTSEKPSVQSLSFDKGKIDDGILLGLISRYRNFGFETYLLPQPDVLPMSNSRDDVVIRKGR